MDSVRAVGNQARLIGCYGYTSDDRRADGSALRLATFRYVQPFKCIAASDDKGLRSGVQRQLVTDSTELDVPKGKLTFILA